MAQERLEDDEEKAETQRLLTRLGDPSVAVVPLFRVGRGFSWTGRGGGGHR